LIASDAQCWQPADAPPRPAARGGGSPRGGLSACRPGGAAIGRPLGASAAAAADRGGGRARGGGGGGGGGGGCGGGAGGGPALGRGG